jgi:hypothetical protein
MLVKLYGASPDNAKAATAQPNALARSRHLLKASPSLTSRCGCKPLHAIDEWLLAEESYLEKKFGAKYLRYKATARRWI